MRVLDLPEGVAPRRWGHIHGESYRGEIAALAAIRTYLCTKVGGFQSADQVRLAARAHLPVLAAYHHGLYEELLGIAEGSATTAEDIVIVNHYTDLRDLAPDPATWRPAPTHDAPSLASPPSLPSLPSSASRGSPGAEPPGEAVAQAPSRGSPGAEPPGDGCSVLWEESASGRILAQTWDMHATAMPYVMVLRVPASPDGPAATLLSVTGCLGMAGMTTARVAIAINNLFSTDATLGVVWPAMVRRALHQPTAKAARDLIATSPIGSGHHYVVADRAGAFALEASGTRRKHVFAGGPSYCHTNHSLDADVAARSRVPASSTTYDRMRLLEADLARAPVADLADAWARLGSDDGWPRSVCTNMATPESPHGAATCGAIAMNLDSGELWAQQGLIHNVAPERWQL